MFESKKKMLNALASVTNSTNKKSYHGYKCFILFYCINIDSLNLQKNKSADQNIKFWMVDFGMGL